MDKMPYGSHGRVVPAPVATAIEVATGDWRSGLPVLTGGEVVLRDLRASDAPALFALLTTEEVARFISTPPTSVEGFERFVAWAARQRVAGTYACFAITMKGYDTAIGIIQVRQLEPGFVSAEWGFAIGSAFWGTGVFQAAAELVLGFAFDTLHVHRLEARACLANGRGIGALRKLGACHEAVLRKAFARGVDYLDQGLFTIIQDEWRTAQQHRAAEQHHTVDRHARVH